MLKEPALIRCGSLTNTELSSQTSESETMETSFKAQQLAMPTTPVTERGSSSRLLELSQSEMQALSQTLQGEQRSILTVKTQKESLTASLDDKLASSQAQPTVSFDQLHIREYARRPGDNPGCRVGVSLTIDWEGQNEMSVAVYLA